MRGTRGCHLMDQVITERQIAKKRQPGEEHFLLNNLISLTVCQVANLIYGEKNQKQLKE